MALAVNTQMMAKKLNLFDHSPLLNFFNAPEFWEKAYDINPFRCTETCGSGYRSQLLQCSAIQDSTERSNCVTKTNSWLIDCVSGCPPVNP